MQVEIGNIIFIRTSYKCLLISLVQKTWLEVIAIGN